MQKKFKSSSLVELGMVGVGIYFIFNRGFVFSADTLSGIGFVAIGLFWFWKRRSDNKTDAAMSIEDEIKTQPIVFKRWPIYLGMVLTIAFAIYVQFFTGLSDVGKIILGTLGGTLLMMTCWLWARRISF